MELTSIMRPENMTLNLKATDRLGVIKEMIDMLYASDAISDKDEILKAVLQREEEFSTGIGFQVAIPHAMPNIFSGLTQAMSSSCTAIMIAEMLGVKSGLGWYMNWSKSWASYDKMFAALFVICIIFTIVTKSLEAVKRHMLRWQIGVEK